MGKGILIILIVVGTILLLAMYQQGGWEGFKAKPIDSSIQSTKTIGKGIKDTYDQTKDIIQDISQNTQSTKEPINNSLTEIGQITCAINEDCNNYFKAECNNACICKQDGICYK